MMSTNMDERQPLLDDEEETSITPYPRGQSRNFYDNQRLSGANHNVTEAGDALSNRRAAGALIADDKVVSVFVVAFDTKAGNLIEWCVPEDSDLEGVEFKAMASGSHTLLSDFCYFKHRNLYGLACFQNMKVESEIERGARMKSVGILTTSYMVLYRHMQFLETQVRHQLETPGKYTQLEAFYQDKKGILPASDSTLSFEGVPSSPSVSSLDNTDNADLRVTHPAGCFSQFLKFFGEKIFVLWKYILLQKRILFFSPPPIGDVCYRVYCACCLGNHSLGSRWTDRQVVPHFYVNVADIETLETEIAYIACTTEKILETKTNLYDVYVDNQNITTHIPVLKDLLRVSEADMEKYRKLQNMRSEMRCGYVDNEDSIEEEEVFTMFFQEQNDRLFHTLLDISMSQDRTLTSEHMRSMGLDPFADRAFLMELVEIYGIDVVLMVDNPCCPRSVL